MTLGGAYDRSTNALLLLMEDLRDRDATFASVTTPTSIERMHSLLDHLATLHARFQIVQAHQADLPQTVCHGDTQVGNTYVLPGDKAGLLDWQLASKGFAMHDVSYAMATALTIGQRRQHERELLTYYREQLGAMGVAAAPTLEELSLEYRRAMVWGVYIGWLTTPVVNYGWEITVMAHLRMMTQSAMPNVIAPSPNSDTYNPPRPSRRTSMPVTPGRQTGR